MKRGYIDTQYGQIHYKMAGDRGPYLFLFHESPLSSWEFDPAIPLLARRCRVVAFDNPGYGQSDAPAEPLDMNGFAVRFREAIDQFGVERFAIGAVHTGSSIALELITNHLGDRVTHAILSGIPMVKPDQVEAFKARIGLPAMDPEGDFLKRLWQGRRKGWGEAASLDMIREAVALQLAIYPRFHWAFNAVFAYDAEQALRRLRCPVYVLNAEGDSLAEIDRQAAKLIAGAAFKLVPGVKGQLPYRAPDVYAREVLAFIGA
jgi:pimeloyl-ACP methyl ester carboxylesterase